MKILVVSPFFPSASSSGACTRSYYLLKALTREYTVSLLILADLNHEQDVVPEGLKLQHVVMVPKKRRHKRIHQALCMLRGKSSILEEHRVEGVQQALDTLFTKEHYDIVLFESALMAADYQLPRCARIVIDEHDIEYELLYRTYVREGSFARKWYNWWESRQIKAFELDRCSNADG